MSNPFVDFAFKIEDYHNPPYKRKNYTQYVTRLMKLNS